MCDLLGAACGERDGLVGADLLGLEAIMLNSIELLANSTRVFLAGIANPLEKGAMCLCPFGQAFVHQGFDPVPIQCLFIMNLGVTMSLDALKLAKELGMGRIRLGEHLQLTIELGYSFIVNPKTGVSTKRTGEGGN